MNMNIPNLLTYFRLSMVPVFLATFLLGHYTTALVIFFVAGGTDLIDGYIARRLNQRSKIGAMLDPLADKLLMVTTFICLGTVDAVPWWFVTLMIVKDVFVVAGVGFFWWKKLPFRFEALFWSKAATLFLVCIGTLGLVDLVFPGIAFFVYPVSDFVFGGTFVTAVLIVITILEYLRHGMELIGRAEQQGAGGKGSEGQGSKENVTNAC